MVGLLPLANATLIFAKQAATQFGDCDVHNSTRAACVNFRHSIYPAPDDLGPLARLLLVAVLGVGRVDGDAVVGDGALVGELDEVDGRGVEQAPVAMRLAFRVASGK